MNPEELRNLLNDEKRILNVVRVFHHLLHEYDKMEELKAKNQINNKLGISSLGVSDKVEIILKDKDGNIKAQKT